MSPEPLNLRCVFEATLCGTLCGTLFELDCELDCELDMALFIRLVGPLLQR